MNSNEPARRRFGIGYLIVVAVLVILSPFLIRRAEDLVFVENLVLGWLYFPLRVIPRMTFDGPALVAASIATTAFVIALHASLKWLVSRKRSGEVAEIPTWRWQGTLAVAILLLILFAAGTAMVGATHQVIWLTSRSANDANSQSGPMLGVIVSARDAARRTQQANHLKEFGIGLHNFHDMYKSLPPGGTMTKSGELLHGWAGLTNFLFWFGSEELDYRIPWNRPPNDRIYKCNMPEFVNPSLDGPFFDAEGFGLAHVAGNMHVLPVRIDNVPPSEARGQTGDPFQGLKIRTTGVRLEDIENRSETILLGTAGGNFKPWGHPLNLRDPAAGLGTGANQFGGPRHWRGVQVVQCDLSVRFLASDIDPKVLAALGRLKK